MKYNYNEVENESLYIPKMLASLFLLTSISIGIGFAVLFIPEQNRPSEVPRITLETKFEAFSTHLNNDNYPDLIIKRNENYNAFLGQEDGIYKPYQLTDQQRKSIEEKLRE